MRPNFPDSGIEFADCMLKLSGTRRNEEWVLKKDKKIKYEANNKIVFMPIASTVYRMILS